MTSEQRMRRLRQMICFNFYSGWHFLQAYYRNSFPPGMNPQRFYVTGLCDRSEGITVSQLARALEVDLPAVSALIGRMEASGLVARRPSPENGREVLVFLTPEGERLRDTTSGGMDRAEAQLRRHIEDEDLARLRDMVDRIRALARSADVSSP